MNILKAFNSINMKHTAFLQEEREMWNGLCKGKGNTVIFLLATACPIVETTTNAHVLVEVDEV